LLFGVMCYDGAMARLFILICTFFALTMPPQNARAQELLDGLLDGLPDAPTQQKQAEQKEKDPKSDIHPAYLNEADLFFQHCEATYKLRVHHDCECLAAYFLDERIKLGAKASRTRIMGEIKTRCIDASEEAFNLYTTCKSNTLLLPKDIAAEVYCTCYGNEYAKIFDERKLFVGARNIARAQTQAHTRCTQGNYAQQNYDVPDAVE